MFSRLLLSGFLALSFGCSTPTKPTVASSNQKIERPKPARNCALGGCDSLPIPEDLSAKISLSQSLGAELFLLDEASARATDIALEKGFFQKYQSVLGGYLPLRATGRAGRPDLFKVFFYTRESPPMLLSEVQFVRGEAPQWILYAKPQKAPEPMIAMMIARQNALEAIAAEKTQPMNTVVLPTTDGMIVYLFAGTQTPRLAIFGKHFRALSSPTGEITEVTRLSKNAHGFVTNKAGEPTAIDPIEPDQLEMPFDEDTAILTVTHIGTDWPLESHVFINLLYGIPLYVVTARGIWLIENGEISYLSEKVPGQDEEPPKQID